MKRSRLNLVPNFKFDAGSEPYKVVAAFVPAGPEPLVLPAGSIKPDGATIVLNPAEPYEAPDRASWFGRKPSATCRALTPEWLRVATKMRARCPESGEPLYGLTEGPFRLPLPWFNILLGAFLLLGSAVMLSKFARMW